jgi:hypothetical protein
MTKSLQEVGACLPGVSMIVLSRVLGFIAPSFAGVAAFNLRYGCVWHDISALT